MARLIDALRRPGLQAIAEFKRRSPSAGDLRPGAEPAALASAFAAAGAAAVSILVDERFSGTLDDLRAARRATDVPLLGKGFFKDREQLAALKEAGADAVLLILRDLDDEQARRLLAACAELGLDALLEAHDGDELERALALDAPLLGLNARDLSTFAISRKIQLELVASAKERAPERIVVAESGIFSRAQAALAELAGADAILVGSALMRAERPAELLAELLSRPLVKVCGLTCQEDVDQALDAGADLVGFIFAPGSPRRAEAVLEVPETALSVAVEVLDGDAPERGADLVQLYRPAPGKARARDAVLLWRGRTVAQVLDLPWGEADGGHLERARVAPGRVVLAGGLGPDNVAAAIRRVRPWAVDAASRLETSPGRKDPRLVAAYIASARAA